MRQFVDYKKDDNIVIMSPALVYAHVKCEGIDVNCSCDLSYMFALT